MVLLPSEQIRLLRLSAQWLIPAWTKPTSIENILTSVAGVQAQDRQAAFLAIRARSSGLTLAEIEKARRVKPTLIRIWCMRGTLHLVTVEDARWLVPFLGPALISSNRRRMAQLGWGTENSARGIRLIVAALEKQGALTREQIVGLLKTNGLPFQGQAPIHLIFRAVLEGLLCEGPDLDPALSPDPGTGQGKTTTYVPFKNWIGEFEPLPRPEALARLALRYLAAYGPAGPQDLAAWSGLTKSEAQTAWQSIAGQLIQFESQTGRVWLVKEQLSGLDDLISARPVVRLLPRFDNILLGYAGRDLAVEPSFAKKINPGSGLIYPTLMVDGRVLGTWKMTRRNGSMEITVEPFESLDAEVLPGLELEVADVTRFLGESKPAKLIVVPPI